MTKPSIHFFPGDIKVPIQGAESVLEAALKNGIEISHSCGGMGSCTTCRVIIEYHPQPLPQRGELEQETADTRGFAENERLACQLPPQDGLVVWIPAETLDSDLPST
jgi:2Fe-2S ferredoxin